MKVLFIPDWSHGNPYQKNLKNAVADFGIEIDFENYANKWPVLYRTVRLNNDSRILHLHWLLPYMKWIVKGRYQIVLKLFTSIIDLILIRLCGRKLIWTVHNLYQHEGTHEKIEKNPWIEYIFKSLICLFAHKIIVHNPSAAKTILSHFRCLSPSKIEIVPHIHFIINYPNTISKTEARSRIGVPKRSFVFLYHGLIREYKGVDQLIKAFKKLGQPNAYLVIAGKIKEAEYESKIRMLIHEEKRIIPVFKFLRDEEIQYFMNAADICVLPYKKILTSGSAILAMSFAKPLIIPKKGNLVDLLDENGAIYYDKEVNLELALKLALDKNLEPLGIYNFNKIKMYHHEMVGNKIQNIYNSV